MSMLFEFWGCGYSYTCENTLKKNIKNVNIIQPIPEGAEYPAKSSNYRGIALASCLGKLLELCILQLFPKFFYTSRLQFGSTKGCPTDLCTGLLKIVSSQYV